ncbi:DUF2333 family protein [Kordiimonas pumila]|uniref:DUF2333 family protein n=1 Tax=Kordiimonas pumila TaxID=2161677 RepID=A0ABV7D9K6_9PROT|nr:DUF2333 family protein [Kordiimonas pumila]
MAKEIWLWLLEQLKKAGQGFIAFCQMMWRWLAGKLSAVSGSVWRKLVVALPVLLVLYILIGMVIVNRIDDTLDIKAGTPPGGSETVAVVAALVEREVVDHNWTPNDPMFLPGWWVDNTPNFQKGIIGALSRFGFELRDQLGRMRGSSAVDEELERAAGNLSKEPDRWIMDFSTSLLPITASDTYFREAARNLRSYNGRLASGDAIFERRADNLLATLDRISLDLGASSAALEDYMSKNAGGLLPDSGADDLFYLTKGQVYAYTLILVALQRDFEALIADRELTAIYADMLVSMKEAATLNPLVVINGSVDGMLANHLAIEGFYLLRARTKLKEVTNILLK